MSDATDATDDLAEEGGAGDGDRPTSFLPPPTFPAAMLGDDAGDVPAPAPVLTAPPDERPARPGLLIRLGHLLCGRPNGTG